MERGKVAISLSCEKYFLKSDFKSPELSQKGHMALKAGLIAKLKVKEIELGVIITAIIIKIVDLATRENN